MQIFLMFYAGFEEYSFEKHSDSRANPVVVDIK